jgi:hypothetical protein
MPRNVGSGNNQDTRAIATHPIHLDKKLSLDSSRSFGFRLTTTTCQRVHLINEDDCWLPLACHLEKLFYEPYKASFSVSTRYIYMITHFSESPCHLLTKSLELMLKNVLCASVATAFAR